MASDFYEILGVEKSASQAQIKKAYRSLAKKYHPDVNQGDKAAEQKFKEITEAYAVLSNDEKRKQYDAFGGQGSFQSGFDFGEFFKGYQGQSGQGSSFHFSGGPGGGFQFDMSGLEDIFEGFTGGGRTRSQGFRPRAQAPQQFEMEIDFITAAKGGEVDIELGRSRKRIKIPAGIEPGQKIRISNPETMIKINVRPSPDFTREGKNITSRISISVVQAMLGDTVSVPTIHGQSEVSIPAGTSSHGKLRLKGKGINGGDHYAEVRIELPKKLSTKAKELVEKLSKELNK